MNKVYTLIILLVISIALFVNWKIDGDVTRKVRDPGGSYSSPCSIDNVYIQNGQSGYFYDTPMASSCNDHKQFRYCSNGILNGSMDYQYASCGINRVNRQYQTSFESINDFNGWYIVPQNHMNSASHDFSTIHVHSGTFSHKAWIYASNPVITGQNTNHRAYPTIQLYKTVNGSYMNKAVVEFYVWLDIQPATTANKDWISFATFTSYADDYWYRTELFNVGNSLTKDGYAYLMHIPNQGEKTIDIFQTSSLKYPHNKWVKLTFLIDYTNNNAYNSPFIKVWQDDQLVSAARFNPRLDVNKIPKEQWPACLAGWTGTDIQEAESLCGLVYTGGLAQAHFGLYAPPLLSSGTVYNDDLSIYEVI